MLTKSAEIFVCASKTLDSREVYYYNLSCIESLQGNYSKAFELLETAMKNGYKNYQCMQQDTDLAPLREQAEIWKDLMKKYFPGQAKD